MGKEASTLFNQIAFKTQDSRLKTLYLFVDKEAKLHSSFYMLLYDNNEPGGTQRHIVSLKSSHLGLRGNPAFEISSNFKDR